MKRISALVAIGLLALPAFAAREWVRRAPLSNARLQRAVVEATLAETSGTRPIVLLETNYYTYVANDPLSSSADHRSERLRRAGDVLPVSRRPHDG
jgi:hypothetical protein